MEYFARLKSNEIWKGHIQIYATNRLITFNYKHKLNDNSIISDFEHLDPYRLENTTYSLSELARIKFGKFYKEFEKIMITLGINWGDSSTATIMENNKIVAAYGEERFSRIKNDMSYPKQAIKKCLSEIGDKKIDNVALGAKKL